MKLSRADKTYVCPMCWTMNQHTYQSVSYKSETHEVTTCRQCKQSFVYGIEGLALYNLTKEGQTIDKKAKTASIATRSKVDNETKSFGEWIVIIIAVVILAGYFADVIGLFKEEEKSQPSYEAPKSNEYVDQSKNSHSPTPILAEADSKVSDDKLIVLNLGGMVMKEVKYLKSNNGILEVESDPNETIKLMKIWDIPVATLSNVTAKLIGESGELIITTKDGVQHTYYLKKSTVDNYLASDHSYVYIIKYISKDRFKFAVASHKNNTGFEVDSKPIDINEPIE